jgi:hypothetical protein
MDKKKSMKNANKGTANKGTGNMFDKSLDF